MAIIKMIKNKALPIILIMAIVVFTMGVIAQDDLISSSSNTEFNVFFQNPECVPVDSDNIGIYEDYGFKVGDTLWQSLNYHPDDSKDNCYKKDGALGRPTCCPVDFDCVGYDADDVEGGECVSNIVTTCGDYESEENCETSNPFTAAYDEQNQLLKDYDEDKYGDNACADYNVPYGDNGMCWRFFDCKCVWKEDDTLPDGGVCKSISNRQIKRIKDDDSMDFYNDDLIRDEPEGIGDLCDLPPDFVTENQVGWGGCKIDPTIVGDCSAGEDFVTRSWTVKFTNNAKDEDPTCTNTPDDCAIRFEDDYYCMITAGNSGVCSPGYCKPGSEVIPCERVVRLPFFSLQNIILAIILLVIIYSFILKKKKK